MSSKHQQIFLAKKRLSGWYKSEDKDKDIRGHRTTATRPQYDLQVGRWQPYTGQWKQVWTDELQRYKEYRKRYVQNKIGNLSRKTKQ